MPGRTIVVGDVHGCLRELDTLLERLRPGASDQLLFLGDLINKGPDSAGVLRRVHELGARSLLGNHEARLLRYRETRDASSLKPEDEQTLRHLREEDWHLFEHMPLTIELPEFRTVAVHGGFLPDRPWAGQPADVVTRIQMIDAQGRPRKRSDAPHARPWADTWKGPEFVVYGHTPRPSVFRRPYSIGIDTGCVYGGRLTALVFPHRVLCQVKAARAYAPRGRRN